MADHRGHVRNDWSAKGWFGFKKTLVKYAHDGIENLIESAPVHPVKWDHSVASSGTFTEATGYDSATSRPYHQVTCDATGTFLLYKTMELPKNFGSFVTDGLINIKTYRSAPITSLKLTMLKANVADSTISALSVEPSTSGVWELFQMVPGTSTYAKGDWITFLLTWVADTIGDVIRVSDFSSYFVSGRGHAP